MLSLSIARIPWRRHLLPYFVLISVAPVPVRAVEDNGNFNNDADPGSSIPNWTSGWPGAGVDGWNYVGQVNGASGTYLGNGWVITAAHVGAGTFTLGGVNYALVSGSTTMIDGGNVDIVLFQVTPSPSLPSLVLGQLSPVAFSAQGAGDAVAFIGYGGGHGETWGLNTITAINQPFSLLGRTSIDFETANGTTTIGTQSVTNNAELVSGDSGGGDFIFNASTGHWALAGINEATGGTSDFVQISTYVQQIFNITGLTAPPAISTEPAGASLVAGSPISLAVAANGSNPLSYQWLKNGTAISGATAATFSIASASVSDGASYTVTVTNASGSATSTAAVVAVAPLNPGSLPATQVAVIGQPVTFSVSPQGEGPFTYQWLLNGTAISGATQSSFTITDATTGSAGNYAVEVSNAQGSVTSNVSMLVPVVSQQTIQPGQSATFTALPSGSGPFTYQWQFNGTNISAATSQSYTVSNAQVSEGGIYTVVVTSASGSVSSSFSLIVNAPTTTDTPAMPAWALGLLALLLFWRAADATTVRPAASAR